MTLLSSVALIAALLPETSNNYLWTACVSVHKYQENVTKKTRKVTFHFIYFETELNRTGVVNVYLQDKGR